MNGGSGNGGDVNGRGAMEGMWMEGGNGGDVNGEDVAMAFCDTDPRNERLWRRG